MTDVAGIVVSKLDVRTLHVPILGATPLIVHRFTEKARQEMLDKQQGRAKLKENRDPERDYRESFYRLDDDAAGFPTIGFKAATVDAARYYGKSVTMVSLRQCLSFRGEYSKIARQSLVRVLGAPQMREDYVTVGVAGRDVRFRAEFPEWSATLTIAYVASMLSAESVLALVEAGGQGVGVGEWRPQRGGENGTYVIDQTRDLVES